MIDLKAEFGKRYRITLDPSASQEPRSERVWHYRIPCKYGHIYVHGPMTLGAYTDRRLMRSRLRSLPFVKVHQLGDEEVSVLFDPAHLPFVAQLLRARKRVALSPERRAAIAEQGRRALARLAEDQRPERAPDPRCDARPPDGPGDRPASPIAPGVVWRGVGT